MKVIYSIEASQTKRYGWMDGWMDSKEGHLNEKVNYITYSFYFLLNLLSYLFNMFK